MKRIATTIIWILFAASLMAADVTIRWDAKPVGELWNEVRVYECNDAVCATPTLKASVQGDLTQAVLTGVVPGVHRYMARSYNTVWGESPNSNQATTPPANSTPGNVVVTVVVTVQTNP